MHTLDSLGKEKKINLVLGKFFSVQDSKILSRKTLFPTYFYQTFTNYTENFQKAGEAFLKEEKGESGFFYNILRSSHDSP